MRRIFWAAVLVCCAPAAVAQPYAGVQVGWARADLPLGAPFNGTLDDGSIAYGFDVGVAFHDRWAVELGMTRYGEFDGRATPCPEGAVCPLILREIDGNDAWLYRVALVPRFAVGPVRLYGKAGYYRARIDTDIDLPDNDFRDDGLMLGAGVRLYYRDPWHLSLEATRYDDNFTQLVIGFGWGARFGFSDRP